MIIKEIIFENFKPYCGKVNLDLQTTPEKNVVLIGGRNGQGKTSFLVGVVWCLYGKNMASVDEIFSKEVKNNYTQWLQVYYCFALVSFETRGINPNMGFLSLHCI